MTKPKMPPSNIHSSKLPLPVEAISFRFLTSPALPSVAILEVDTDTNPIRIALGKEQLARLEQQVRLAAAKVTTR